MWYQSCVPHTKSIVCYPNNFLSRLMVTATTLRHSVSGIAKLKMGNSGVAVVTDIMDELVLVVSVMDEG